MTNPVIITVEDGSVVVRTPQTTVTVTLNCQPCPDCPPAPFECESQPSWSSGQPVVFRFTPGQDVAGNTAFEPAAGIGQPLSELPESIMRIENAVLTNAIGVTLMRSPHLSSARSATVILTSAVAGEPPLQIEVEPSADGTMFGEAEGSWQLTPDELYCATIIPAWGE